jgi:hypothetical protein
MGGDVLVLSFNHATNEQVSSSILFVYPLIDKYVNTKKHKIDTVGVKVILEDLLQKFTSQL